MKVYMKDKPAKYGIKVSPSPFLAPLLSFFLTGACMCVCCSLSFQTYMIADSLKRYVLGFDVYVGARKTGPIKDQTAEVVRHLARPFLHEGRTIVADNFFTSIPLALDLLQDTTYLVGTLKSARVGVPEAAKAEQKKKKERKKRKGAETKDRDEDFVPGSDSEYETDEWDTDDGEDEDNDEEDEGQGGQVAQAAAAPRQVQPAPESGRFSFKTFQASRGGATLPLCIHVWHDRSDVLLINTSCSSTARGSVRRLQGIKGDSQRRRAYVEAPLCLEKYQAYMGSVDRIDQSLSYTNFARDRQRKPWKVIFYDLLDIAIHNAFVLYKEYCKPLAEATAFRKKLAEEMIGDFASGLGRSKATQRQRDEGHLPLMLSNSERQRCRECDTKTAVRCVGCDAFFCLLESRNCYTKHHKRIFHIL
jgi:hypothetical protein